MLTELSKEITITVNLLNLLKCQLLPVWSLEIILLVISSRICPLTKSLKCLELYELVSQTQVSSKIVSWPFCWFTISAYPWNLQSLVGLNVLYTESRKESKTSLL